MPLNHILLKKRCSSCLGTESQWKLSLNLCVLALCWEFNVIFSLAAVREPVIVFRTPPIHWKVKHTKKIGSGAESPMRRKEENGILIQSEIIACRQQQQQQQQCSAGDGIKRQVRPATSAVWRSTLGRLMRSERKSGTCKECTESVDTQAVVVRDGRGASCNLLWIFNPPPPYYLKFYLLSRLLPFPVQALCAFQEGV